MKGYCDKCGIFIEDLNGNEEEEYKKLGHFTCSSCINDEMDEELKERKVKELQVFCCNKEITEVEEGVNGSDFYVCQKCGKTYNVITGQEKD